jgi:soluble lytic murein transglycosylase-like protein
LPTYDGFISVFQNVIELIHIKYFCFYELIKVAEMHKYCLFLICFIPVFSSASCWKPVGEQYGIDPLLLKAIAWKESRGNSTAVGPKLTDGNVALGLMQINSIHLENLKQFGIDRDKLFDACINQQVGAWVLANCIAKFGPVWKAVGCYYTGPYSTNIAAQVAYVRDVQRFYAGYKKQEQYQAQLNQRSKAI